MPLTRPSAAQINTVITTISDPITVLNKGSTAANIDVGFIINRNGGALANTAIFWNESANTFATAFTTASGATDANISISAYANLKVSTLTATFVNTTGNIVSGGNVTAPYFFGNGALLTGIVASGGGSSNYGDSNVASYLPTYSGIVTASNVAVAGNVTAVRFFGDGSSLTGVIASTSSFPSGDYGDVSTSSTDAFGVVNVASFDCGAAGTTTTTDLGVLT